MKLIAAPLLLFAASVVSGGVINKAVWQLAEVIQCAQPGVNPFIYNNYGCWCGIGGWGNLMDDVDECCKVHDKCYETSRKLPGCTGFADLPYIALYKFTCSNKQVSCSDKDTCKAAVCECDREAAHCFARHKYNPENKNLDRSVHCVS